MSVLDVSIKPDKSIIPGALAAGETKVVLPLNVVPIKLRCSGHYTMRSQERFGLPEEEVLSEPERFARSVLDALRGRYDYVFTTGGIGPTHDDITVDAVARAFGVEVMVISDAEGRLLPIPIGRTPR